MIYSTGSLSPRRRSHFDDCVDQHAEAIRSALNNVGDEEGSSSGKASLQSGDWASSEDDADAMEAYYEGC